MNSFLELEVLPEIDDELKISVQGSSFGFSGNADCYVNENDFLNFAKSLEGFPVSKDQVASFTSNNSDLISTFELVFTNANNSGHIKLDVTITHISNLSNAIVKKYSSNFGFVVMPAQIDKFQKSLLKVANSKNIGHKALLN